MVIVLVMMIVDSNKVEMYEIVCKVCAVRCSTYHKVW